MYITDATMSAVRAGPSDTTAFIGSSESAVSWRNTTERARSELYPNRRR